MTQRSGVSRRRFMKRVAGTAAVPAALMGAATHGVAAVSSDIRVAATVVRASHSAGTPDALRIGVRASVLAPGFTANDLVFVVDEVRFGASPQESGRLIAESVRSQVADLLRRRGTDTAPERIQVQVFGGAL